MRGSVANTAVYNNALILCDYNSRFAGDQLSLHGHVVMEQSTLAVFMQCLLVAHGQMLFVLPKGWMMSTLLMHSKA